MCEPCVKRIYQSERNLIECPFCRENTNAKLDEIATNRLVIELIENLKLLENLAYNISVAGTHNADAIGRAHPSKLRV